MNSVTDSRSKSPNLSEAAQTIEKEKAQESRISRVMNVVSGGNRIRVIMKRFQDATEAITRLSQCQSIQKGRIQELTEDLGIIKDMGKDMGGSLPAKDILPATRDEARAFLENAGALDSECEARSMATRLENRCKSLEETLQALHENIKEVEYDAL